jgi:hypothetical protein
MSKRKDKIAKQLREIGAGWAVRADKYLSPDDPLGTQARCEKTYHVHPDICQPEVTAVLRFRTLADIERWIKAQKDARWFMDKGEFAAAGRVVGEFWESTQ